MSYKMLLLMRKEFLQFMRNIPLLLIVLYCSTLDIHSAGDVSMDVKNFPIGVYDLDHTAHSRELIDKLQEPYFQVKYMINRESDVRQLIESGRTSMVVVIPEGFGKKINSYTTAEAQAIVDGSMSNASQMALNYLSNIIYRHNMTLLVTRWQVSNISKAIIPYVDFNLRYFYNQNLNDKWTFCFQEFLMSITLIGVLLTATAMVNEKQFGTIEQLMVAPLKTHEIMISKIVPMMAVLFVAMFIAVFTILIPVEGMPLAGNIWAFFFVSILYFFSIAGLGLFISTISSNLSETVLFSLLILIPIMFLSGSTVAPEVLPGWVKALMHLSPLKYYLDLGNGIFFKGNSLISMWKLVAGLFVVGASAFAFGAARFRKVFQ